jgi:hypothetical protein
MELGGQRYTSVALSLAKRPVTVQEAGWFLGPVLMGAENLARIGI